MSARPELVFFLKESLEFRTELQLRQQLKRRGVGDADFEAALQESLYPPEYPDPAPAGRPTGPSTPWALLSAAVLISLALGFIAGRLPGPAAHPAAPMPAPEPPKTPMVVTQKAPAPTEAPGPVDAKWAFKGIVYDLTTLRPIPEVAIILADGESGRGFKARSNAEGRYHFVVPAITGRGYEVSFSHPDYAPTVMDEDEGPARSKSEQSRLALAGQLAHTSRPLRSLDASGGPAVATDFYLAPR